MAQVTNIISLIRGNIDDNLETKTETHTYTTSKIFTLLQDNTNVLLSTLIDGAVLAVGETATLNTSTNKVTVVATLVAAQELQFQFNFYSNYSDTQIKAAIQSALSYISINDLKDFYYNSTDVEITPYPSKKFEYLIALIAAIILKPNYTTYKTSTVEIRYPGTKTKEQKIKDTIIDFKFDPSLIFGI